MYDVGTDFNPLRSRAFDAPGHRGLPPLSSVSGLSRARGPRRRGELVARIVPKRALSPTFGPARLL